MIDTIAEHGLGIRALTPYQLSTTFLDREVEMLKNYIQQLLSKRPKFGYTVMCNDWTTNTRKPLINFMIYSNCNMIFHMSGDTTEHKKTKEYIFKIMNKVIDEIGESHVV